MTGERGRSGLRRGSRILVLLGVLGAAAAAGNAAQAQNCQGWPQQVAARDPRLMQGLAGIWGAQEPNGVGGVAQVRTTLWPDGRLLYEKQTCISMPGLSTSCPQSIGHGEWAAHFAADGTVFFATNLQGSSYNGQPTASCGGNYVRLIDWNTTMDANGNVARRLQ